MFTIEGTEPLYLHDNDEFAKFLEDYFREYHIEVRASKFELYIDFPFCRSICKYCAFSGNKYNDYIDKIEEYGEEVVKLLYSIRHTYPKYFDYVYFGGGTPSLWDKYVLGSITHVMIPQYRYLPLKIFEAHPADLDDDTLSDLMVFGNMTCMSLGVQSLDVKSNKDQNRIPTSIDQLKHIIDILHGNRIYVNIDIVALFNYDDEEGWNIYLNDMETVINELQPDDICSVVNFRASNYYEKSLRIRKILNMLCDKYPEYSMEHPESLSTNMDDIIRYGEEPYHFMRNTPYKDIYINNKAVMDSNIDAIQKNNVIGIGGTSNHPAISRLGMIQKDIYTYYDFNLHKFIHQVVPTNIIPVYDGSIIPEVKIGKCTIDSTLN